MTNEDSPPRTRSKDSPEWLTQKDMDLLCIGVGPICVHCNERLPATDEPDRVCPTVSDIERVHEVARKLHDERQRGVMATLQGDIHFGEEPDSPSDGDLWVDTTGDGDDR